MNKFIKLVVVFILFLLLGALQRYYSMLLCFLIPRMLMYKYDIFKSLLAGLATNGLLAQNRSSSSSSLHGKSASCRSRMLPSEQRALPSCPNRNGVERERDAHRQQQLGAPG